MQEFSETEIESAIDAAGRRNIANWELFDAYGRHALRHILLVLALEWLRRNEQRSTGD